MTKPSTKFSIQGCAVEAPNGKSLALAHDIKDTVQIGNLLIVILHVPEGATLTENVFAISETGQILWQIERINETSFNPQDRYLGIVTHDQDTVTIGNWNGMVVDVDLRNGRVKAKGLLK
ncbi:MAG: hypothetical protein ABSA12_15270 [Verrucomicrobiia bacterium]